MGDGQGVVPGVLTEEDVEKAAAMAAQSFGQAGQVFIPAKLAFRPIILNGMAVNWAFENSPEYSGTPWAKDYRFSKRERMVAQLHTTLHKLEILKGIDHESFDNIHALSVKRLRRAKWAQRRQKRS